MTVFSRSLSRSAGAGVLIAASFAMFATGPADAAELGGVINDVTVTPTSAEPGDLLRVDVDFCVPDSATVGDTFSLTLPSQLSGLPTTLVVYSPNGDVVADTSITGSPAVAVFTLTDYVDRRNDVCGSAFFESQLSSDVTPDSQQRLTFVVGGGATFETVVTVGEAGVGVGRDQGRKGAYFGDAGNECRVSLDSCLGWYIETRTGPFASVTIADDGLVDASFECDQFSVRLWTVDGDGLLRSPVSASDAGAVVTKSCTADSIDVEVSSVPANVLVRTLIRATPSVPDPEGGTVYRNAAGVTYLLADETTVTEEVQGSRRSARVGGLAVGVTTTTTTTSTATEAPTTSVDTTTSTTPASDTATTTTAAVTTTSVESAAVTTPSTTTTTSSTPTTVAALLPATGTGSNTMSVTALLSLAAGGCLLLVARRRTV